MTDDALLLAYHATRALYAGIAGDWTAAADHMHAARADGRQNADRDLADAWATTLIAHVPDDGGGLRLLDALRRPVPIDSVPSHVRTAARFVQAVATSDRDQADALYASVTDPREWDRCLFALLQLCATNLRGRLTSGPGWAAGAPPS